MRILDRDENDGLYGRIRSEGKKIEVIPIITDAAGQPMMLPPAVWDVESWILGMNKDYVQAGPYQFYMHEAVNLPGSQSNATHRLQFLVRILEGGANPTGVSIIDATAVALLIDAVKAANAKDS